MGHPVRQRDPIGSKAQERLGPDTIGHLQGRTRGRAPGEAPSRSPSVSPAEIEIRERFIAAEEEARAAAIAAYPLEAQLATGIITFAALFTVGAPLPALLTWAVVLSLCLGGNAWLYYTIRRQPKGRPLRHGLPSAIAGAAALGLAWGLPFFLAFRQADGTTQVLLFAALGVAAASGKPFAIRVATYWPYLALLLGPPIIAFIVSGNPALMAAGVLVAAAALQIWTSTQATRAEQRKNVLAAFERSVQAREISTYVKGMETANRLFAEVVTDHEKNERELEVARASAEAASRAKSEFLAYTSHEIRTPLNAIIGLTDQVLQGDLAEQHRNYLSRVRNAGDNLLALINDLLDMGKIEAGKLTLESLPFSPAALLAEIEGEYAWRAQAKGLVFNFSSAPDVPLRVSGDALRLRQILVNLVGNALKFTQSGTIAVSAAVTAMNDGAVRLRFSVRDTGIGLSPEQQATLFERYRQADLGTARQFGGTGLGLAIVRSLVELQRGVVGVKSALGRGSDFHFELPFAVEDAEATMPPGLSRSATAAMISALNSAGQALRVLIADDNDDNRLLAQLILERRGYVVSAAANGEAALALHRAHAFDLLFFDMEMPILSGLEAVTALRLAERTAKRAHVPIIALSAHADDQFKEICMAAGCSAYVTKPLREASLTQAIARATRRTQYAVQPAVQPAAPPAPGKLVVFPHKPS